MSNETEQDIVGMRDGPRMIQKWVSVGDVLVLVSSLIALAITYGKLSADVDMLKTSVAALAARDITPGAAQGLASCSAHIEAQEAAMKTMREDAAEFRKEMRDSLKRIEDRLKDR